MFEEDASKNPLLRAILGDMTGELIGEGSLLGELIFEDLTTPARFIHRPRARGEAPVGGAQVLDALPALPGGQELLEAAAGRTDVELVGGAVRDLLLGLTPHELDVVAGDAAAFADELAARLDVPPVAIQHERFGTVRLAWDDGRIDIASRRAEDYPAPGALPVVQPGTPEEDLRRRDFTVNAIAVPLGGPKRAAQTEIGLRAVDHSLSDLAAGRLRVLHDQSFLDDPTRLLRLARYHARLGFAIERHTATLAQEAIVAGALDTVSGARLGAELRLLLREPSALYALMVLSVLEALPALHPWLRSEATLERDALMLLPIECRPDLLLLASLLLVGALRAEHDPRAELVAFLDRMEFPAADRDRVVATITSVPRLVEALPGATSPSALRDAVRDAPLEAVALAGALKDMALLGATEDAFWAEIKDGSCKPNREQGEPPVFQAARRWLRELRHVRLRITGDDLLAAGVPEGPEIGRLLEETLRLRLDGELPDEREPQLEAALRLR
jgi:tRNA nucleotidyltransferase (CCA-adding enzyme)